MATIPFEILFILLLVLTNGIFAMAEIAVVSARKARLQQLANEGDAKARAALELAKAPNRFLSTVQVGITLAGVLAGAFGGATIAEELAVGLTHFPLLSPYSEALGVGAVVLAITCLSLILGELVPKRLALNSPERIASAVAAPWPANPLSRKRCSAKTAPGCWTGPCLRTSSRNSSTSGSCPGRKGDTIKPWVGS